MQLAQLGERLRGSGLFDELKRLMALNQALFPVRATGHASG